ncbi:MAG: NAD(P)-dependent oxidoreductase [Syntrophaceae bacterium]
MNKKLITGINGYIGSNLARALLREGNQVIGIDLDSGNIDDLIHNPNFEFRRVDITDPHSFPDEVRQADVLIHCAALVHKRSSDLSRENYFRINHTGTKNVLDSLDRKALKQILFLSTVSVYGDLSGGKMPDENTPLAPEDYYGESKVAAEKEIREFSESHKTPYTIFRLAPVYGDSFLLNIHKRVYLPGELAFYKIASGEQRLSLCSVNNIADVIISSMSDPSFLDQTFNMQDLEDYSINDIILFFKGLHAQQSKPVVRIPCAFPLFVFRLLSLLLPKKAEYYAYQLKKVSENAEYSVDKLRTTRVRMKWNLYNTFLR